MPFSRAFLAVALLLPLSANAASKTPAPQSGLEGSHSVKTDRVWKRYRNAELGYCLNYPSRWTRGDAFEGSGLFIETGLRRYSKPIGEIDVGPAEGARADDARLKPASLRSKVLIESLQEHRAGLQKFARAERLQVIAQRELTIQGYPALYAKNTYYDPLERVMWMEEVIFVDHKGEVYRLELQCPPSQIERFGAVFAHLVDTLEFDCK